MPISGSFFDEEKSYLGMEVTVQTARIDKPAKARPSPENRKES
jgi:hypothetical protein